MTTDHHERIHVYTIMLTHDYKCEQSCIRRHLLKLKAIKNMFIHLGFHES